MGTLLNIFSVYRQQTVKTKQLFLKWNDLSGSFLPLLLTWLIIKQEGQSQQPYTVPSIFDSVSSQCLFASNDDPAAAEQET